MTKRQQKVLRQNLMEKLYHLAGPTAKTDDLQIEQAADPLDSAQSKSLQELAVHVMNTGWEIRRAIEAALERMRRGEYGVCECCEDPIHPRRLKALPWATRCVPCQEQTEAALSREGWS